MLWLGLAGFAVVAVALRIQVQQFYRTVAPVVKAAPIAEPSAVELAVEPSGSVLIVRWNPNTAAVSRATHGLLTITDGDYERHIGLNSRDLMEGSTRYAPLSRNVSFQLALYDGSASGKGSVLFLARAGEDTRDSTEQGRGPEKVSTWDVVDRSTVIVERSKDTPARRRLQEHEPEHATSAATRPIETATGLLPTITPEPVREASVAPPVQNIEQPIVKAPVSAPALPGYRVTVTARSSRGSRMEQVLGRVPFIRRITKTPSQAELVKAVRRVEPQLEGTPLTAPIDASVEIQVDDDGKVKSAKLVELDSAPGNVEWASLRAAKSWRFESPKEGQSSWLVLTFHFEPAKALRGE